MTDDPCTEGLLRALAPRALGVVVRRYGNFADAEDAVQEALLAAASGWAAGGQPDNPLGWLIRLPPDASPISSAATTPAAVGSTSPLRCRPLAPSRRLGTTTR